MLYDFRKIEAKWRKVWEKKKAYEPDFKKARRPFYNLMMFPYPSAEGLHIGGVRTFTGVDIYGRFKRMQGYDVFEPIGLDGFGIHSENYALKTGKHPFEHAKESEKNFYRQLGYIGNGFAWKEHLETYDPEYYKWTQWIFTEMFRKGLAYRKKQPVNWCPSCKTVLADEQVISAASRGGEPRPETGRGECERCGSKVIKKDLEQWFFKITDYAGRLLKNLNDLDWADVVKTAQRNWIGQSHGAELDFEVASKENLKNADFIFLHAFKGHPRYDFWPWLTKEAKARSGKVFAPTLPHPSEPDIEEQVQFLLRKHRFTKNSVIVTHSLGGVLAMKLLPRLEVKVRKLVMVAPPLRTEFLDGKKRPALEKACDWKFDFKSIKAKAREVTVLADEGDHIVPASQPAEIARKLSANLLVVRAEESHFHGRVEPEVASALFPKITVFTTRPDTLFGATYMVLAPEHKLIESLKIKVKNWREVERYIKTAKTKGEEERIAEGKEKTGVELKGVRAINPATREEIPIWVADYVLSGYGTGAIMAVPAHDERDFEFAKKYELPIKQVIEPLFIDTTEQGKIRDGIEFVERNAIMAIVKHWSENKYIGLRWKRVNWRTLITGAPEKGQSPVEGAIAEIREETGYLHPKLVRTLHRVHSKFYHVPKGINRLAHFDVLYFELQDGKREELSAEEKEIHDVEWLTKEEMAKFLSPEAHQYAWRDFLGSPVYAGEGFLVAPGKFNGIDSGDAKWAITASVRGKRKNQYRLRDWLISRQRYWGPPIPVIFCSDCKKSLESSKFKVQSSKFSKGEIENPGWIAVPESKLPVKLPYVKNFQPRGTGKSPLASVKSFYEVKCPKCGGKARRETDVSDTFLDSAWYFLRYPSTGVKKRAWDPQITKKWLPVHSYIGGAEHSVLHLLYSRFLTMAMKDARHLDFEEPFSRFRAHGLITKNGAKMSKSRGNVVNPDEYFSKFGADATRMYLAFLAPLTQGGDFRDEGIAGITRFLERVWKFGENMSAPGRPRESKVEILRMLNRTIKKVGEDMEDLKFNTAVSALMVLLSEMEAAPGEVSLRTWRDFCKLLAPLAPFMAEELYQATSDKRQATSFKSIHREPWPAYDPKMLKAENIRIVVQVNGKVRDTVEVGAGVRQEEVEKVALESGKIRKFLGEAKPKRVIYVPGRLINFVC